jgi:hypothetical protein
MENRNRHAQAAVCRVLFLLSTRLGTFMLVGFQCFTWRPPFMTAFFNLPPRRIERILRYWLTNKIPLLRCLGRGVKGICLQAVLGAPGVPCCH